jgi:CheY-like chemotaxis protein
METVANKKKSAGRVLLAEDDDSMRRYLSIVLKRAGYEVASAEDGLAAMKIALTEESFDVIIADGVMPNLSGHELCRMLRHRPQFENLPIIILSGFKIEEDEKIADVYLTKGEKLQEELLSTLTRLLAPDNPPRQLAKQ